MRIINNYPPNIEKIAGRIDLEGFNPIFTYGDVIYNPTGKPISDDLMAHEEVHQRQQKMMGVENWWNRYLTDKKFRLTQEIEAYREQYLYAEVNLNRRFRKSLFQQIAKNLSSALYGNLVNKKQAEILIKGEL